MSDWLQFVIIMVIVLGIGVAIWRGGSANPTGTGHVARDLHSLKTEVGGLGVRVGNVERDVLDLKEDGETTKDIEALRREIALHMQSQDKLLQSQLDTVKDTKRAVGRIEQMLMERGLGDSK